MLKCLQGIGKAQPTILKMSYKFLNMKKLLFVIVLALGFAINSDAKTTISFNGFTTTLDGNANLPNRSEIVFDANPRESTERWSFPVYWYTDEGSGSFTLSGDDSVTTSDILDFILALFF